MEASAVVFDHKGTEVFIDAPMLKYLHFEDDITESKMIISNTSYLTKSM